MIATKTKTTKKLRRELSQPIEIAHARRSPTERQLRQAIASARSPKLRSRVEFAEQVVVIPEGPHQNKRWRRRFQPYAWWLLHLHDTMGLQRSAVTGCVQSGKTLNECVINACWHLFERKDPVIYGIPSMDMARDKWQLELLPVIDASPWMRQWLPTDGVGSKGGTPSLIRFKNGARLKFMSAHGRDDKRSAITANVVIKTEVDRYDQATEASRETSPADQMDNRAGASGSDAWIYEECTVTTEEGRIWQQYHRGTQTQLWVPCPACGYWVLPARDHLVGHEDASTATEARELTAFTCPECSVCWSEEERQMMQDQAFPLHAGQSIDFNDEGEPVVNGDVPEVDLFSFKWNAFHNRFWSTGFLATEEWEALRSPRAEDAEKEARQFRWALPAVPEEFDLVPLTMSDVLTKNTSRNRGVAPAGTVAVTVGVDIRNRELHFVAIAWSADGSGHICDYGILPVASDTLGVSPAILAALEEFRDGKIAAGYYNEDRKHCPVAWVLVDAGYKVEVIRAFMRRSELAGHKGFLMAFGRGQSEPPGAGGYSHPDSTSAKVRWIGWQCHVRWHADHRLHAMFANSDEWKTFVHEGLSAPLGVPGSLSRFEPQTTDERRLANTYARQVTAERAKQVIVPRRGAVTIWDNEGRSPNHFLDATYNACVGGYLAGVRVAAVPAATVSVAPTPPATAIEMPDGRPFMEVGE